MNWSVGSLSSKTAIIQLHVSYYNCSIIHALGGALIAHFSNSDTRQVSNRQFSFPSQLSYGQKQKKFKMSIPTALLA